MPEPGTHKPDLSGAAALLRKLAPAPAAAGRLIPVGQLQARADALAEHVALWARRPSPRQPAAERPPAAEHIAAGHAAVADVDAMLRELHAVRSRLVRELRQDEDVRARRVDLYLSQHASTAEGRTEAAARLMAECRFIADLDELLVAFGYPEAVLGHDPRCRYAAAAADGP